MITLSGTVRSFGRLVPGGRRFIKGVSVLPVDLDFIKEREANLVLGGAKLFDFLIGSGFLTAELVAREAQHHEALVFVVLIERLNPVSIVNRGRVVFERPSTIPTKTPNCNGPHRPADIRSSVHRNRYEHATNTQETGVPEADHDLPR